MKKLFNAAARKIKKLFGAEPLHGRDMLQDPAANKSTAFTREERDAHGLRGLLPHHVSSQQEQVERALEQMRGKPTNIEKYVYLAALQDRNERVFYKLALDNIEEVLPLIYTPTVGEASQKFSHIFRRPRGMYITPDDKGKIRDMLDNWPEADVRAIVITDGQRILGLGDLGANGMGIPIGKLALYTIGGGIDPQRALPVMFDMGTDNKAMLADPAYLGYPHPRVTGPAYDALMQEFIDAVKDKWPKAMVQFEDFKTENAFRLMNKYRDQVTSFNDDIQGTAAVALAGVLASERITGKDFKDERIMFVGAGSAATGIADLMVKEMMARGLNEDEARSRISLVDSKGLVTKGREKIEDNKKPFAQDHAPAMLLEAIDALKPTVLIGATGVAGAFPKEAIEKMAALNERPVIFALSNPTSHTEATPAQVYGWSRGKAIYASGSPFAPVTLDGTTYTPGQANNAYIFPGIGLGVTLSEASKVTDSMFLAAARALAGMVSADDIKNGTVYPPLKDLRKVSAAIAKEVIVIAGDENIAGRPQPATIDAFIAKSMYDPGYAGEAAPKVTPKTPKAPSAP